MRQKVRELLDRLQIDAPDSPLLDQAFRHKSLRKGERTSYKPFEILGDSVIRTILLAHVIRVHKADITVGGAIERAEPFWANSFFAWISNHHRLFEVLQASNAAFGGHRGKRRVPIDSKIRADLVESFIGALHMVGGYALAEDAAQKLILVHYDAAYAGERYNAKALLEHFFVQEGLGQPRFGRVKAQRGGSACRVVLSWSGGHMLGEGRNGAAARNNAVKRVLRERYGIA